MVLHGNKIKRWLLFEEYLTPENIKAIELYFEIKNYGWPFSGGWAEQPAIIFRLVKILDFEMERRKSKNGQ